jgi:hypothetical protein
MQHTLYDDHEQETSYDMGGTKARLEGVLLLLSRHWKVYRIGSVDRRNIGLDGKVLSWHFKFGGLLSLRFRSFILHFSSIPLLLSYSFPLSGTSRHKSQHVFSYLPFILSLHTYRHILYHRWEYFSKILALSHLRRWKVHWRLLVRNCIYLWGCRSTWDLKFRSIISQSQYYMSSQFNISLSASCWSLLSDRYFLSLLMQDIILNSVGQCIYL